MFESSSDNGRYATRATAAMALFCAGLVGGSFFVEHVLLVEPCPLCLIQRYVYLLLAIVFAAAALQRRRSGLRRGLLFVGLAFVVFGGGVAAYQSKLQLFPAARAATCTPSLSYMLDTLPMNELIGRLFEAHGDCSDTSFKVLGLTLAQISLVASTLLLVALVTVLRRRR
jgi:disulfide bond formation protein DsbB